jgi:hypothetical protein
MEGPQVMIPSNETHILVTAKIDSLRPTQITVGYREVQTKRRHWETLGKKERARVIDRHWFPAVLGPQDDYFIVDHHHLGLALHEEGEDEARIMQIKDLSWLDAESFWRMMEHNQWVHPYDADGKRRDYGDLPKTLTQLADDPYRSLAGEIRIAGGYAKDATPFSEFLWADYLRPRIKRNLIVKDFDKALHDALALAHAQDARYLPGWSGVVAPPR